MVFAVYEQGMRIHTPRKDLLGRRGIDALKKANATRRLSDTESDSSHLERTAERSFEQVQRSAVQRREEGNPERSGQQSPELLKKAIQAYAVTEKSHIDASNFVSAAMVMSTPIISANFDHSLQQGWSLMQQHGVKHLLLLNRKGELMGLVSDKDILKVTSGVGAIALDGRSANDIMLGDLIHRQLLTVSPNASLLDVAQAMLEQKLSALPVVTEEDTLKGIITRTDLLQAMLNGRLETWY